MVADASASPAGPSNPTTPATTSIVVEVFATGVPDPSVTAMNTYV